MCCSCGCGHYRDGHNSVAHLTEGDLRRAARTAGISLREVAENITAAVRDITQHEDDGKEK